MLQNILRTFPAIVNSVLQNGWIAQIAQQGVDGQIAHPSLASVSVSTMIMSAWSVSLSCNTRAELTECGSSEIFNQDWKPIFTCCSPPPLLRWKIRGKLVAGGGAYLVHRTGTAQTELTTDIWCLNISCMNRSSHSSTVMLSTKHNVIKTNSL